MLVQGSKVRTREEDEFCAVENLGIGDFVFDPFADKYCELIDILSRRITVPKASRSKKHPLQPIVIRSGSFGQNRPKSDVAVSPFQELLLSEDEATNGDLSSLNLRTAEFTEHQLHRLKQYFRKTVNYFALFTSERQFLDVEGLLMPTYSPEVFKPIADPLYSIEKSREIQYLAQTKGRHHG